MEQLKLTGYNQAEDRYLTAVELLARVVCKQEEEPYLLVRPQDGVDYQIVEAQL